MLEYEHHLQEILYLLRQFVELQNRAGWPQWAVSLFSVGVGGVFGFMIGYWKDRLKERRDIELLREALYQEIANNYEAIIYWFGPERCNFDWLKQNIHHEITFFAYEAAGKSPGGFYRIREHEWLVAIYRELKRLCTKCEHADDKELIEMLRKAAGTIETGDEQLPETKDVLRSKLQEQYRANIK